jgi:hypothetical protein
MFTFSQFQFLLSCSECYLSWPPLHRLPVFFERSPVVGPGDVRALDVSDFLRPVPAKSDFRVTPGQFEPAPWRRTWPPETTDVPASRDDLLIPPLLLFCGFPAPAAALFPQARGACESLRHGALLLHSGSAD